MSSHGNNTAAVTEVDLRISKAFIFDMVHADITELDSVIGQAYASLIMIRLGLNSGGFVATSASAVHASNLVLDGATQLLLRFRSLHVKPVIFTRTILKWIPILSECCGESFWESIFPKQSGDNSEFRDIMDLLVTRCIAYWNALRISSCQSWILKKVMAEELGSYSTSSLLKCIVHKACQLSH